MLGSVYSLGRAAGVGVVCRCHGFRLDSRSWAVLSSNKFIASVSHAFAATFLGARSSGDRLAWSLGCVEADLADDTWDRFQLVRKPRPIRDSTTIATGWNSVKRDFGGPSKNHALSITLSCLRPKARTRSWYCPCSLVEPRGDARLSTGHRMGRGL